MATVELWHPENGCLCVVGSLWGSIGVGERPNNWPCTNVYLRKTRGGRKVAKNRDGLVQLLAQIYDELIRFIYSRCGKRDYTPISRYFCILWFWQKLVALVLLLTDPLHAGF